MATACASIACRGALGLASRASVGPLRAVPPPSSAFFTGTAQISARAAPKNSGAAPATARRAFSVRALSTGDKLPAGEFAYFDKDGNMQTLTVEALTKVGAASAPLPHCLTVTI